MKRKQFSFLKSRLKNRNIWLKRVIRNGWQNITRNKALSIATLLVITLIFFVFNLTLALRLASDSVILSVGRRVDIRAEILPEVENYRIQGVIDQLQKQPFVKEVLFTDKTTALEEFGKKYPNVITFLERNQLDNPLPSTLRVIGSEIADNNRITSFLENKNYSQVIDQVKLKSDIDQKTRQDKIIEITKFIKGIGIWLNIVLASVVVLILFNSINLTIHSNQREISIMNLVGAKKSLIQGGYLFEGIFYALTSFLLSIGLSQATLVYLTKNLIKIIQNESLIAAFNAILLHFDDRVAITFLWQFIGVILLGLISSYLAIELHLKKGRAK